MSEKPFNFKGASASSKATFDIYTAVLRLSCACTGGSGGADFPWNYMEEAARTWDESLLRVPGQDKDWPGTQAATLRQVIVECPD